MVNPFNDWSNGWIKEGHYLEFMLENVRYYERVRGRDLAHWEYAWPETVSTLSESGPFVPELLEVTRGYNKSDFSNRIWQIIFGIRGQVLIYVELPTDIHRHGIPKDPKPGSANRYTSHFTEYMTPFMEPSFCTEHFMMREVTSQIGFDAYNPEATDADNLRLNILINKMDTERVGTVEYTEKGAEMKPTQSRWQEVLDKLYRGVIPCRPVTLLPVRAAAAT